MLPPPNLSLLAVYDWGYGGLDVHSRMRGSVYDQAGPKSFDLPGRNQLIYWVESVLCHACGLAYVGCGSGLL